MLVYILVMAVITGTCMSPTYGLSCAVDTAWTGNTPAGVITSPKYTSNYPRSQSCRWSFTVNDNYQVVVIRITDLVVLKGASCTTTYCVSNVSSKCIDHLTLQEEGNSRKQLIICGTAPPPTCFVLKHVTTQVQSEAHIISVCRGTIAYVDTIQSPNNVYFYSDSGSTRKGFSLKFNVVNVTAVTTQPTPTRQVTSQAPTTTTSTTTPTTKITTTTTTQSAVTTNTATSSTTTSSISLTTANTLMTSTTTSSTTMPPLTTTIAPLTTTVKGTSPPEVTAAASSGVIIGAVVGVVVGLIIIIVLVFYLRCRRQKKPTDKLPLRQNITNRSPANQATAPDQNQNGHMVDNVIYDTSEAAVYVNTREKKAPETGSNSVVPPSNKPDDLYAVVDMSKKPKKKERQVVDNVLYDGFH